MHSLWQRERNRQIYSDEFSSPLLVSQIGRILGWRMPEDPRNLPQQPDTGGSSVEHAESTTITAAYSNFESQKLNLSKVDLNPDAKDSISREYAKRLAMKHAYAHSLAHYTPCKFKIRLINTTIIENKRNASLPKPVLSLTLSQSVLLPQSV